MARVAAVEEAQDREMLRLAEESLRRGHPEQAAIVYQKAADRYQKQGKVQKELAVLKLWTRVAPNHPAVWSALGRAHHLAGRHRDAIESLARAAALHRDQGQDEPAAAVEGYLHEVRVEWGATNDVPPSTPAEPVGLPAAQPPRAPTHRPQLDPEPEPVPLPGAVASMTPPPQAFDLDDGPLDLDIPETGDHQSIQDEDPDPISAGALDGLDETGPIPLSAGALEAIDEEPDLLSASALQVLDEDLPRRQPILPAGVEASTEPGVSADDLVYPDATDRTVGMSAIDMHAIATENERRRDAVVADDEIDPETMDELTRMVEEEHDEDEDDRADATIAMPAIGHGHGAPSAPVRPRFSIPNDVTVMDPGGLPGAMPTEPEPEAEDEDDFDSEEVTPLPENRTRAYSVDEIAKLLKDKGR